MAKKKSAGRRLPQGATPRTFGNGRAAQAGTSPAPSVEEPQAGATQAAGARPSPRDGAGSSVAARPTYQEYRRHAAAVRSESRPQQPLREEYRYVPGDLKRLGLLASGMVVLMLLLGLIIH